VCRKAVRFDSRRLTALTPSGHVAFAPVHPAPRYCPLLANILLDELDHELERRGHDFVRYADDFVILCKSPRAGERILTSVKRFLRDKLKLVVNEYQRSAG